MHDGGGGEQDVQVDPDRTEGVRERPNVVCGEGKTQYRWFSVEY